MHQHGDGHGTNTTGHRSVLGGSFVGILGYISNQAISLLLTRGQFLFDESLKVHVFKNRVRSYPVFFVASGTELIPTSMMTAPSLTQSFFTYSACPIAATKMSASRQISSTFLVLEWQTVTVALAFNKRREIGIPTMLLRPKTTAFLPATSTPERFSNSMHPLGVQGTKSGSWPFKASLPIQQRPLKSVFCVFGEIVLYRAPFEIDSFLSLFKL